MRFKSGVDEFRDPYGNVHQKPHDTPVVWRPSAYASIVCGDGLLMVEDVVSKGRWGFPGGGIEAHESLLDGLRREGREELGTEIMVFDGAPRDFCERSFCYEDEQKGFLYCHALCFLFSADVSPSFVAHLPIYQPQHPEITRIELVPLRLLTIETCQGFAWEFVRKIKKR